MNFRRLAINNDLQGTTWEKRWHMKRCHNWKKNCSKFPCHILKDLWVISSHEKFTIQWFTDSVYNCCSSVVNLEMRNLYCLSFKKLLLFYWEQTQDVDDDTREVDREIFRTGGYPLEFLLYSWQLSKSWEAFLLQAAVKELCQDWRNVS